MTDPVQWDPEDYAASSASQARWGQELISRIAWCGDERVLDVGCGDGRLTMALARKVPSGEVLGIDSSADMIAHARAVHSETDSPNLRFLPMDARRIKLPSRYDLVFSNAALHWIPDHPAFLRGAADVLRPGGRLMVSCGGRGNAADVFAALRTQMRAPDWRACFRNLEKPYFLYSEADYDQWLPEAGFKPVVVRLVSKDAVHEDTAAFKAWLRTTWMPYTQRVPEERRGEFIEAVVQCYLKVRPVDVRGAVRVRMVRLELDAVRI